MNFYELWEAIGNGLPATLYHVTSPDRLDAIQMQGLKYRLPSQSRHYDLNDGICLALHKASAITYGAGQERRHGGQVALLTVHTEHLDPHLMSPDPNLLRCYIYKGDIPATEFTTELVSVEQFWKQYQPEEP